MSTVCSSCGRNAGVDFAFCPFCGMHASSPSESPTSGPEAAALDRRNAFDRAETFYQPVAPPGGPSSLSVGQAEPHVAHVAPPPELPEGPYAVSQVAAPSPEQSPAATTEPREVDAPHAEASGKLPLAFVIERSGPGVGTIHRLRDFVVIGRGSDADIVLADPAVSKRHAEIRFADGRITFEDLGSTNLSHKVGPDGSRRPLVGRHVLGDRDRLDLGETRLAVVIVDPSGSGGDSA